MGLSIPLACGLLLLGPAVLQARLIGSWPYEKLVAASDLIVIAEFASSKDVEAKPSNDYLKHFADVIVGQVSTLNVRAVLKGKSPGNQVEVFHLRLKGDKKILNGPLFVHFRARDPKHTVHVIDENEKAINDTTVVPGTNQYLLFLKRRAEGRYEPVSGEVDPELSIRKLDSPNFVTD